MNIKFVRLTVLAVAMFAGCLSSLCAAESAPQAYADLSTKMLKALENGTFDQFIADGDASWRKLSKGQFDGIAGQIGPRLKAGYDVEYMGELKRSGGSQLTLWKLVFSSGGDDMLVTMTVKDGKVSGFGFPRI